MSMRSGQRSLLLSGDAELYVSVGRTSRSDLLSCCRRKSEIGLHKPFLLQQQQFMTGNRSAVDVPRVVDALYTLCANETLFAPFFDSQLLVMNLVNNSCKLSGLVPMWCLVLR